MAESIVPTKGVAARRARRARRLSEVAIRALLSRARHGTLVLHDASGSRRYGRGGPEVQVTVHDPRTYHALLRGGSMGFGESFTDGWWDCDDLTLVVRFVIKNLSPLMGRLDAVARTFAPLSHIWQRLERVDRERDRANIRAHYDVGNDFYSLMLDETMMYSCAYFADESTSLHDASVAKLEKLCSKLRVGPDDHVLEIGTGWGGFAVYAAKRYGCRVTTVTISDAQFEYVRALVL
ncbi:MAG: class I SAM-dependent methyltransferase, partial [Actinomycetota bacterium]|nr:class I SAM-dependent methyltransferase [Actinomycetota bacterium]